MFSIRVFLLAAVVIFTSNPTKAATVTYNLALAPLPGYVYGGTGILTLAAPIDPTFAQYGASDPNVLALSFSIDGYNFDLLNHFSAIQFINGALTSVTAAAAIGVASIQSSGTTGFYFDNGNFHISYVTISAALAASPVETPLPAALPLFASGLGGLAIFGRRRKRKPLA
jgi:hypothetical protein